ncbi:hypothetical protein ACQ4M4_25820 [Leptolyngbya sp. AN02str]|uniref:hypothetical protein n=1 Tax=Leptolyngbya sp. AN02str TaxID=3423363 RepID=UPI003D321067
MAYATWKDEIEAFEADCQRLRKSRRESFPVKVLGVAPTLGLLFIGTMPPLMVAIALAGMAISGISLLLEMDAQREAYGGNLALDLNPNSDYDNLAGAFRTRSPRWEALAYLYSQLDPIHLKDRLGHLDDSTAKRTLDRMIRRVREGLNEIREIPSHRANYAELIFAITAEFRAEVTHILDKAMFKAGVVSAEDVELDEDESNVFEEGVEALEPLFQQDSNSPTASPELPLFDWAELRDRPNMFPHLLLLGKTGAGKSTLAEMLLPLVGGELLLITPHHRPGEFPGVRVVGAGRNYGAIAQALDGLHQQMQQRYQRYAAGDESYPMLNVVIDEYPAIAANCDDASTNVKALAREARKVKMRLIILSQGGEVKALGIAGEGSLRECFTYLRGRGFVEDHARRLKNDALVRWVGQQPYPWMVEDMAADTSVLKVLEPLLDNAPNFEAAAPAPASGLPPAWEIATEPNYSPDALRLLQWLQRQPGVVEMRALQQAKPLGKVVSHSQDVLQPILAELLTHEAIAVNMEAKTIWAA